MIAVGKLSQPIPLSKTTDTTFQINFDYNYLRTEKLPYKPIIPSGSTIEEEIEIIPPSCEIGSCIISASFITEQI